MNLKDFCNQSGIFSNMPKSIHSLLWKIIAEYYPRALVFKVGYRHHRGYARQSKGVQEENIRTSMVHVHNL